MLVLPSLPWQMNGHVSLGPRDDFPFLGALSLAQSKMLNQNLLPQLVLLLCLRKGLILFLTLPLATSTPWNHKALPFSLPLASLSHHSLEWDAPVHTLSLLSPLAAIYFPSDTSFLAHCPECVLPQSGTSWRMTYHGLPLALWPQGRPSTPVPLGPHPRCPCVPVSQTTNCATVLPAFPIWERLGSMLWPP